MSARVVTTPAGAEPGRGAKGKELTRTQRTFVRSVIPSTTFRTGIPVRRTRRTGCSSGGSGEPSSRTQLSVASCQLSVVREEDTPAAPSLLTTDNEALATNNWRAAVL